MNLTEAFSTLARSGCRLKLEAAGSIILDVPPGSPPVPSSVLEALAMHREILAAVLTPQQSVLLGFNQDDLEEVPEPTPEEIEAKKKWKEDIFRRARAMSKSKLKQAAKEPTAAPRWPKVWQDSYERTKRENH